MFPTFTYWAVISCGAFVAVGESASAAVEHAAKKGVKVRVPLVTLHRISTRAYEAWIEAGAPATAEVSVEDSSVEIIGGDPWKLLGGPLLIAAGDIVTLTEEEDCLLNSPIDEEGHD